MSAIIRKRNNKDGTTSIVLETYVGGVRRYKFLKECKLVKPLSPKDRLDNKEKLKLAEKIKTTIQLQIQSEEYDIEQTSKSKVDFVEYFNSFLESYNKKDKRVMIACFNKFKEFLKEENIKSLPANKLSESLIIDFKEFLESKLNGESPVNYFKKFKIVLKKATRDKILKFNPANDVTISRNESIKKDILNFDEIQLLANSQCGNAEVKRAFLFSCFTGLRFCDIIKLKVENINNDILIIKQQKTQKTVTINLNENAKEILNFSVAQSGLIFNLPSHTACLKNLRTWTKKANINKKVTWHVARHSFGTNLVFYGSDLNSASALLGHSSFTYTQKYVRVVESLKEKAVNNLPTIKL